LTDTRVGLTATKKLLGMLQPPEQVPWHVRLLSVPHRALQGLATIGAWLVWPLDVCIHWVATLIFGTAESLDAAEFGAGRLLWIVLAPFRLIGYLFAQFFHLIGRFVVGPIEFAVVSLLSRFFSGYEASEGAGFLFTRMRWAVMARFHAMREAAAESTGLPRLLLNILAAPLHIVMFLTHVCTHAFMVVAEFFNLDIILAWTIRLTRPVWYPLAAVAGFFVIWFATRTRRQLAWGVPAFLVLIPALWIVGEKVVTGNSRVAEKYRIAVNQARRENDMGRMYLYERKLTQLGVDTQTIDFYTALGFAQGGKYEEAYQRMCRLAPENRPGHANAHIWIIQSIINGQVKLPPQEAHRQVGIHLDHLATLGIESPEVDIFRACWLSEAGDDAQAAEILKPIVRLRVSTAIDRMRLDLKLNHLDEARKDALVVEEFMDRAKRANETISSSNFQWWCVAEDVLGHEVRLRSVVADWIKFDPKNERAMEILGKLLVKDLDTSLATADSSPEAIVKTIQDAYATAGTSADLKQRTLQLYHERRANPALGQVFDLLLSASEMPPSLAETLGTSAATDRDWETARRALERAVEANPNNAVAWNNLAFVLLQQGKDLDRALEASNRALQFSPDNYHLRETRGQILVKLKRWDEAIGDLEFALNGLPNATAIHQSLALSYDAVGNPSLGAMHRQSSN
jgi:tetratricopeptide (TPR) repeat protein